MKNYSFARKPTLGLKDKTAGISARRTKKKNSGIVLPAIPLSKNLAYN
jgi:hypothetical protein